MIIIEVRFGAINGNAITIDDALSPTSTNPVQNKIIAAALDAIQQQIESVAANVPKEVVSVEDYDALFDIEDPSTEVVYITEDTGELYTYNGEEFVLSTNRKIDNTIYVDDIGALIDMSLPAGVYPVACVTPLTTESYTLNVSSALRGRIRLLTGRIGYAVTLNGQWSWTKYSFEGHTHQTSDVNGLPELLALKQDATDNNLNTDSKTIVGAINEVNQIRKREYSVNFYGVNGTALEHNLSGRALTIGKIVSTNIRALSYSIQNGDQNVAITLVNGQWVAGGTPAQIVIPDGAQVAWKASRIDDSEIAEITIKEA